MTDFLGRRCRLWAFVIASCACGVLTLPGSALASNDKCNGLTLGPFQVRHGFKMTLEVGVVNVPGRRLADVSVNYTKTQSVPNGQDSLFLDYFGYLNANRSGFNGGPSSCTLSSNRFGSLTATWGKVLSVKLQLRPGRHRGEVDAKGRLIVGIHPQAFGTIRNESVTGLAGPGPAPHGPCRRQAGGVALVGATFPGGNIMATSAKDGSSGVEINDVRPDRPSGGIRSSTGTLLCGGPSLFSASTSVQSATIGAAPPFTHGSLSFTCTSTSPVHDGTVSGTLTVANPALGPLSLVGSPATYATLQNLPTQSCNPPAAATNFGHRIS